MNGYCRHKLKEKIKIHRELGGLDPLDDIILNAITELIFNGITEFGKYEITWKNNIPVQLTKISDEYKIEVMSGKYYIMSKNNGYAKQLYSSEFIDFNLKEYRDSQINKIL